MRLHRASQTGNTYVLHATGACVEQLPRTVEFGAEATLFDAGGDFVSDRAPDTGFGTAIAAGTSGVTQRLAGTDRILTAIELSQDRYADGAAGAVVLAAASGFPDALAGGPLATTNSAPLLLTGSAGLDARVRTEIERVLAPGGTVFVLGGTAALGDQVVLDVAAAGYDAQRVAGADRFETAVAIADEVNFGGGAVTVLVADGRTFTDALLASAAAPRSLGVVVLTDGTTMPASTAAYLDEAGGDQMAIGTAAATAAPDLDAITAPDAVSLSVAVADALAPIRGAVAVASVSNFPDSLAGGPHIAVTSGPLLLTNPTSLSAQVRDALEAVDDLVREVAIYGGTAAVSPGVQAEIDAVLAP